MKGEFTVAVSDGYCTHAFRLVGTSHLSIQNIIDAITRHTPLHEENSVFLGRGDTILGENSSIE